jgi:hypothetical protein
MPVTKEGQKKLDKCIGMLKGAAMKKFTNHKCDCGSVVITSASEPGLAGTKIIDIPCPENVTKCVRGPLPWSCPNVEVSTIGMLPGFPGPVEIRTPRMITFTVLIDFYKIVGFPVLRLPAFLQGGGKGTMGVFGNGNRRSACKPGLGAGACEPGAWARTIAVNRFGLGTDLPNRSAAAFWFDPILEHFAAPSHLELAEEDHPYADGDFVEGDQFPEADRQPTWPPLSGR